MNTPIPYVAVINNTVKTTSLKVAEYFNKRHADVLRAIDKLNCSKEYRERNFAFTFQDIPGPNGSMRQERVFEMTKDGFVFLVMGFTGKEAAQWKEAYIDTFNLMEDVLRNSPQMGLTFVDDQEKFTNEIFSYVYQLHTLVSYAKIHFPLSRDIDQKLKDAINRLQWNQRHLRSIKAKHEQQIESAKRNLLEGGAA